MISQYSNIPITKWISLLNKKNRPDLRDGLKIS